MTLTLFCRQDLLFLLRDFLQWEVSQESNCRAIADKDVVRVCVCVYKECVCVCVCVCIKGVSRLVNITAGGDFLGLCNQKS